MPRSIRLGINRRLDGAWSQRYEHGVPVTGLVPLEPALDGGTTGTTVHFHPDAGRDPDAAMPREDGVSAAVDPGLLASCWPRLTLEVEDLR